MLRAYHGPDTILELFKLVKISQHYEADKLLSPSEDKESKNREVR